MADPAIYASRSTVKSLWQEYRIYGDRLELDSPFGLLVIPFEHIERVDVSESDVGGLLRGDLRLKDFRPALKLDWANFTQHVVLDKDSGRVHRILFTPEDPRAFKESLDRALSAYRGRSA
jgi:hypothetical protein